MSSLRTAFLLTRTGLLAGAVGVAACMTSALLPAPSAWAQASQRGPVQRILTGKVTNKSETPIKGAVVYLKDEHSLTVKSYISEDDGSYRFGQLSTSTDYTVYAEIAGEKSKPKSISSFETKNQFTINLKIDNAK